MLSFELMMTQLRTMLDQETVGLLGKLVMRAIGSGNANLYLKTRIQLLLDESAVPAVPVKVTSRVVSPPVKKP